MKDIGTFEELEASFNEKSQQLADILILRDVHEDPEDANFLILCNKIKGELTMLLQNTRQLLAQQKEELQEMKPLWLVHKINLQHIEENLPEKLPKPVIPQKQKPNRQDVAEKNRQGVAEKKSAELTKQVPVNKGPYIRTMDYVMVDEFHQVPKYMKGRVTYEQINQAVDEFNSAIRKKYEIMFMPKKDQTEPIRNKIFAFKKLESKDTKGFYFVTEEDLAKLSDMKMSNSTRSILTILRHIGKLKLIRSPGLVRHAIA